jgi:Anti-sigma-K factor rskA
MTIHAAECDDIRGLAAGLALDVLDEDEQRRVLEHVARCPECADALDRMREAAAVLGSAPPQVDPPPALRDRLLAAARAARPDGRPVQPIGPVGPRALRRPRVTPAWAAIAAAIVVSVGSLAWAASLQRQVAQLSAEAEAARAKAERYDRVVQVLESNQLSVRPLEPVAQTVHARGTVYLDPASGSGMLMVHDLPPPPPGYGWQLWFVRGSERMSGGMLWTDANGTGYALIRCPKDLQTYDSLGLTQEPSTGSAWPTSPRILGTAL